MKVLQLNIACLILLGVFSQHPTGLKDGFWKSFRSYFVLAFYMGPLLLGNVIFILQNYSTFDWLHQLTLFLPAVAGICSFISTGMNTEKIKWLVDEYQTIVDQGIKTSISFPTWLLSNMRLFKFLKSQLKIQQHSNIMRKQSEKLNAILTISLYCL